MCSKLFTPAPCVPRTFFFLSTDHTLPARRVSVASRATPLRGVVRKGVGGGGWNRRERPRHMNGVVQNAQAVEPQARPHCHRQGTAQLRAARQTHRYVAERATSARYTFTTAYSPRRATPTARALQQRIDQFLPLLWVGVGWVVVMVGVHGEELHT